MNHENKTNKQSEQEKPDTWWYRVYAAALIFTALFIAALWLFERVFSS